MHFEIVFLILFSVATAVALVAGRLKVPYTVALVAAGLVLGAFQAVEAPHLTRELLYVVILPGLLYEAAYHLDFRDFWQNRISIHTLAVAGVAAAIIVTAGILSLFARATDVLPGFTFTNGLVFGAVIAATDPIAVVALFKSLGAPKRLRVLVEGESLLNDGTAVVIFTLILEIVAGGHFSAGHMMGEFGRVVGTGVLAGGTLGYVAARVIQRVDDPMIEITLTTIAAYGSFVLAETFHGSGVIATVTAGMLSGNYAARTGMSPSTRIAAETFWEYVAFALNSIVFLLIGFEVKLTDLARFWQPILLAYLAVTLGRAAVVFGSAGLLRRTRERIPWKWNGVMVWAGLRGALAMVLALGLAPEFPHRTEIVTMTFGVVVLTILFQGLSMAPLLRALGIVGTAEFRREYEIRRGRLLATRAALAELDRMDRQVAAPPEVLDQVRKDYEGRTATAREALAELNLEEGSFRREEDHAARRHLLLVEKDRVLEAHQQGLVGEEAFVRLVADIDARLVELEEAGASGPEAAEESPPGSGGGSPDASPEGNR
jgi:CPA1 family monovalent cation:H+ antiporter